MNSQRRPFACVPGRDVAHDRASVDIARYYYDGRVQIAEDAALLRDLIAAVGWTNDLAPTQWAQWYSVALGFAPDLILELGRGRGNSTAVFTQAAARLGRTRVISLCQSGDWTADVAPRIAERVEQSWFDRLDARMADILSADYEKILAEHGRVLLLWDAHGFEIAELVLGEILPRLASREHLVLLHDISDNRYASVPRSYGGQPLWKGSKWQARTGEWDARVNIGWMNSIQDQVVALADFSARNDLEIGSADHEYATFFAANPRLADEMRETLGQEMFSTIGHWAFMSLTGKTGPFHFPAVATRRPTLHRAPVVVDEARRWPVVLMTDATAWAYAASWAWRPTADVPARAHAQLQIRLSVEGGPIGLALLDREGKTFVESKIVGSGPDVANVLIPIDDLVHRGRLVIHTWDKPVPARVRIDDLSIVW